jgi:hypothetical protein
MRNLTKTNSRISGSRHSAAGFTIVELLIAVLLAGLVTSASMALYMTQHKQMLVQEEVSDMQANVRAATMELADKIRMAGYNVPDGMPAIVAGNTNPDSITLVYDSDVVTNCRIESPMALPSADLRCDGHDLSALHDNDWLYIYDPTARTGEFFLATQIQYAPPLIRHSSMAFSRAYPTGSKIMKLSTYKFYINRADTTHPALMIKLDNLAPQVYADNITNLNFRYVLSTGETVDVPMVSYMIREVRINVVARNDKADREFQTPYRTRTLTTRVKVRNLGVN